MTETGARDVRFADVLKLDLVPVIVAASREAQHMVEVVMAVDLVHKLERALMIAVIGGGGFRAVSGARLGRHEGTRAERLVGGRSEGRLRAARR